MRTDQNGSPTRRKTSKEPPQDRPLGGLLFYGDTEELPHSNLFL